MLFYLLPSMLPFIALLLMRGDNFFSGFTSNNWNEEYDYIIIGAGTGGSVMANRLSENSETRVLLLEAGGDENFLSRVPLFAPVLAKSPIDWNYTTVPQEEACLGLEGRISEWPRGKVLGGSSSINFMLYVRGNRQDYDQWADLGCEGWNFEHVFPYFLKNEDNADPEIAASVYHATGGYQTVETRKDYGPIASAFPKAGEDMGYIAADFNGANQLAFMNPQMMQRHGERLSESSAYLYPIRDRKNLDIVTHALVTKIIFNDQKVATSVQFDRAGGTYTVRARKEIILSGGAINSPQLLMLSGVGPRDHLEEMGIEVVADSPGVGQNLQDHISGEIDATVRQNTAIVPSRDLTKKKTYFDYLTLGSGPLTSGGSCDGIGFIRTERASERYTLQPDIELYMLTVNSKSVSEGRDGIRLLPTLLHPKSRGFIKLKSTNPYEKPIINPRYLTEPDDVKTLVSAMKFALKFAQTPAFLEFNTTLDMTPEKGCESYEMYSDDYLECAVRHKTLTIWHPTSTCKMGPANDPLAVVDPQLRVRGVKNLRVVDASVMPLVISGNTNTPTAMIAEKISDLIMGRQLKPFAPDVNSADNRENGYKKKSEPLKVLWCVKYLTGAFVSLITSQSQNRKK